MAAAALASAAPAQAAMTNNTIAPTATLSGRGHVARASVLIACTEGQLVRFSLTLAQGDATRHRPRRRALHRRAHRLPGGGGPGLDPGRGHAGTCAIAENYNRRGEVEGTRQWCRAGGVSVVAG